LLTPADANTGQAKALISSLRERIETTFSQLWRLFVDRVYSRSWNGLWTTIKLKMLHFNLASAGLISARFNPRLGFINGQLMYTL
jgi:hypothetical protein